jgi:hypothetical protein
LLAPGNGKRVKRAAFSIFIFLVFSARLFAFGSKEEAEVKTRHDEWHLCITEFDTASLPEERHVVAGVITRKLVEKLNNINYRTRISHEYAYYEETAWITDHSAAARALAAKQNERSLLIYKGEPRWKYRQDAAKIDGEIEKLRLALEEVENNPPAINTEPEFALTPGNLNFTFPAVPTTGNENRFCLAQKADAFLQGSVSEFHGRFLITLKLYVLYTQSFIWEDRVIFSHDDLEEALDEITRKLIIVLSGNQHSTLTITAQPEETLVLINRSFAGRGGTGTVEYPPGTITVTASAPDYESVSFETELLSGEITDIKINLRPVMYGDIVIGGSETTNVYRGALFVGEAPLTLRLPINNYEYVELIDNNVERGTAVFQTPETPEYDRSLSMRLRIPQEKGRVDKARRAFYWAWGATWLTGVAAWLAYHSYLNSYNAIVSSGTTDRQFINDNRRMYNISMGTLAALGVTLVLDVIFIGRYLYISNKDAAPITKPGRIN